MSEKQREKNEVYALDLDIESSLKQLAWWCTDIIGIKEMTISKISEEEIKRSEEKMILHSYLDRPSKLPRSISSFRNRLSYPWAKSLC